MIRELLEKKYGTLVSNHLMNESNEVFVENYK